MRHAHSDFAFMRYKELHVYMYVQIGLN